MYRTKIPAWRMFGQNKFSNLDTRAENGKILKILRVCYVNRIPV